MLHDVIFSGADIVITHLGCDDFGSRSEYEIVERDRSNEALILVRGEPELTAPSFLRSDIRHTIVLHAATAMREAAARFNAAVPGHKLLVDAECSGNKQLLANLQRAYPRAHLWQLTHDLTAGCLPRHARWRAAKRIREMLLSGYSTDAVRVALRIARQLVTDMSDN